MLNKVIIMGRMTADAELKRTPSDTAVTTFTVACDRDYQKDKQTETDFISCVAWRRTAEFISKYFGKGKLICLAGRLQTRNYEDRNGNKRTVVDVVADDVYFCGKNEQSSSSVPLANGGFNVSHDPELIAAEPDYDPDLPF